MVILTSRVGCNNPAMNTNTLRYQLLRAVMKERGYSVRKLADMIHRGESQCSSFAGSNPKKNIGERLARHIEQSLNLPPTYLDDVRNLRKTGAEHIHDAREVSSTGPLLPVIGQATAGALKEAIPDADIEEYVPAPGPCSGDAFVLIIDGISMLPDFHPHERVVIDPEAEWVSGDVVYARRTDDNTGTLKEIRYEDGDYYLCARNPKWEPQYLRMDGTWEVVGKALYLVRVL